MEEADHQHDHHRDQQEEEVIIGCKEQQNTTITTTTTTTSNNNNNIIIKGKRTKRLRLQSPIPFAIPMNSSTAEGGGGGGGGECNNTTNSSPTTSEEYQDSTEEEEDMANCLILLAQGHSRGPSSSPKLHQPHNDHTNTATTSSRRFLEATPLASAVGTNKVAVAGAAAAGGYYVYECKTCNRTFPSFQALGGHRASHKKPKTAINVDDKKQFGIGMLQSDEEDTQLFKNMNINNNTSSSSPLSLHLSNRGLVLSSTNNKSKVHECSICGAEFNSGQALGGHMRRHRAPVGGPAANATLALTAAPPTVPLALEAPRQQQNQHQLYNQQQQPLKKQRSMLSLDLDLNLPAPEDDQHHRDHSKFVFTPKQQQQQQTQQPQQQQQQQERCILSAGESDSPCKISGSCLVNIPHFATGRDFVDYKIRYGKVGLTYRTCGGYDGYELRVGDRNHPIQDRMRH